MRNEKQTGNSTDPEFDDDEFGDSDGLRSANPWFEDIFVAGKTEVNVLVVADGGISFEKDADFGLTEFIKKGLSSSIEDWMELKVVTAHRSENAKGAMIPKFRFDQKPKPPYDFPLSFYDAIWLFGQEAEKDNQNNPNQFTLCDSEVRELSKLMNSGRGVFATGDHEDLGAALCGKLPRVGSMRKWFLKDCPPPRDDATRLDTLREGFDQGFLSNDQADRFPQEIRPIFKLNLAKDASYPHEVLRMKGNRAIQVLPDHMHEGECVVPSDLKRDVKLDDGTCFREYPPLHDNTDERLAPETIALSTSVGGFVLQLGPPAQPVVPRLFSIIVAYDGHSAGKASDTSERAGVGRVVVDSSFHHFVNINLRGTGSGDNRKRGLYDFRNRPTREYQAIKQYYRNLRKWLLPPEKQASYYANMLLAIRYVSPLIEEIRHVENPDWHDVFFAGSATRRAITERFSSTDAAQSAFHAAGALGDGWKEYTKMLLEPWVADAPILSPSVGIFNLNLIIELLLGGAMLGLAEYLPQSPGEVKHLLEKDSKRQPQLQEFISQGVVKAGRIFVQELPRSQNLLTRFLEILNTPKITSSQYSQDE